MSIKSLQGRRNAMSYLFIHLLHHNDKTEEVLKTGYSGMKGQCRTK